MSYSTRLELTVSHEKLKKMALLNILFLAGVFLPELCEKQRANPHRSMVELMSSGAAPGPAFQDTTGAPGPAYQDSTGAPGPAYQISSTGEAPGPDSEDFFVEEEAESEEEASVPAPAPL